MALFLEFLAEQWILAAALLAVITMLVLHETRKSGPSLSPQQAINLVNAEQGIFLGRRGDEAEPVLGDSQRLQRGLRRIEIGRNRHGIDDNVLLSDGLRLAGFRDDAGQRFRFDIDFIVSCRSR